MRSGFLVMSFLLLCGCMNGVSSSYEAEKSNFSFQDTVDTLSLHAIGLTASLAQGGNCSPYQCRNGFSIPRCDYAGVEVNYYADPCHRHGGSQR